jgi:formylglycine-generating enzyme required for sulfatase activity
MLRRYFPLVGLSLSFCLYLPHLEPLNLASQNTKAQTPKRVKTPPINAKPAPKKDASERIEIPEGWFVMGSAEGVGIPHEHPQHKVWLDRYWMGKCEVTVGQFRKYCNATGYRYDWTSLEPYWKYQNDYPMVRVTWEEARAYCRWAGGDLPTEAQWEKAARGVEGRTFPWLGDWDAKKCVNWTTSGGHPAPVGSWKGDTSPYGVMDMAGNVDEWCRDWYDGKYYAISPERNPEGPESGKGRVVRGSDWDDRLGISDSFRCAHRGAVGSTAVFYIGFRCVYSKAK